MLQPSKSQYCPRQGSLFLAGSLRLKTESTSNDAFRDTQSISTENIYNLMLLELFFIFVFKRIQSLELNVNSTDPIISLSSTRHRGFQA